MIEKQHVIINEGLMGIWIPPTVGIRVLVIGIISTLLRNVLIARGMLLSRLLIILTVIFVALLSKILLLLTGLTLLLQDLFLLLQFFLFLFFFKLLKHLIRVRYRCALLTILIFILSTNLFQLVFHGVIGSRLLRCLFLLLEVELLGSEVALLHERLDFGDGEETHQGALAA